MSRRVAVPLLGQRPSSDTLFVFVVAEFVQSSVNGLKILFFSSFVSDNEVKDVKLMLTTGPLILKMGALEVLNAGK